MPNCLILVFNKLRFGLLALVFCVVVTTAADDKLVLKIDSLFIKADTVEMQPTKYGYSVSVHWVLQNIGKNTAVNVNPLWYVYAANVQTDTMLTKENKKRKGCYGIGNALLKWVAADSIHIPAFFGFIESPGDNRRISLEPQQKIFGRIGGFFSDVVITDTASIVLEYNTLFQQTTLGPIWRGKIRSPKYKIDKSAFSSQSENNLPSSAPKIRGHRSGRR
jgi:hypothetical protein